MTRRRLKSSTGSTGLITLGIIAALIVVLSIPILVDLGDATEANLGELLTLMGGDTLVGI